MFDLGPCLFLLTLRGFLFPLFSRDGRVFYGIDSVGFVGEDGKWKSWSGPESICGIEEGANLFEFEVGG